MSNIAQATNPEAYLIGQIQGVVRFSVDSDATKLATIDRYIKEYDAAVRAQLDDANRAWTAEEILKQEG